MEEIGKTRAEDLFRVSIFGGFNKQEVQAYVEMMEDKMEALGNMQQKEKEDMTRRLEEGENREKSQRLLQLNREIEEKEEELRQLRAQIEEEKKEAQKKGKEQDEWEQIDLTVAVQVLADARENAKVIEQEAKEEAKKILEAAKAEARDCEAETLRRMNEELEKKGIQLFAAKHKIGQYAKSVKQLQEGLFDMYTAMNFMSETMPVRVEDYWKGANYRMLDEDKAEEEQTEEKKPLEKTII